MFDDDTFTDTSNLPRVEAIAEGMGELGMTWSCNAKANVPYKTLKIMKDNGLRLLLVGYRIRRRPDPAQHQEGPAHRHRAALHGGLPQARDPDPRHLHPRAAGRDHGDDREDHQLRQGDQSAHHPGIAGGSLPGHHAVQAGGGEWLAEENEAVNLVNDKGVQLAAISYPHLSKEEIFHSMEVFYKRFYFRPSKIWEIVREMLSSWDMMKRRLREGVEFFRFLRAHAA